MTSLSDRLRSLGLVPPPPKAAEPGAEPSDQAKRFDHAVPKPSRCVRCGFLLNQGRCGYCPEEKR